MNVGEMSEAVVKKLKTYVDNGGSLTYFMGDEVKPDFYNTTLFKAGVFPLLIGNRPYDPLAAEIPDLEKRRRKRFEARQINKQPKILFPKPDNPLVAPLVPYKPMYYALSVNVYWQAQARSRWDPDLRSAEPLVVLPNTASMATFQEGAQDLMEALSTRSSWPTRSPSTSATSGRWTDHATADPRRHRDEELYRLGTELEDLLKNPGVDKNPEKPSMADLWKHPEMKNLGAEISEFRERVLSATRSWSRSRSARAGSWRSSRRRGRSPARAWTRTRSPGTTGERASCRLPSYLKLMLGLTST